jgi:hypothetical protein
MPETTSTSFPHRANIIAIKHVLHRIYSQKTIIVWAVMTMEVVISILKLQESHISFRSLPANCGAFHRVVLCIMAASTLAHQAPPPIVRLELTILLIPAAGLQMTLQISVPKICAFIIWQQIHWLVGMPQAKCTLICHQVSLNESFAARWVCQCTFANPIRFGFAIQRLQ